MNLRTLIEDEHDDHARILELYIRINNLLGDAEIISGTFNSLEKQAVCAEFAGFNLSFTIDDRDEKHIWYDLHVFRDVNDTYIFATMTWNGVNKIDEKRISLTILTAFGEEYRESFASERLNYHIFDNHFMSFDEIEVEIHIDFANRILKILDINAQKWHMFDRHTDAVSFIHNLIQNNHDF
jgi:hypothetical protein